MSTSSLFMLVLACYYTIKVSSVEYNNWVTVTNPYMTRKNYAGAIGYDSNTNIIYLLGGYQSESKSLFSYDISNNQFNDFGLTYFTVDLWAWGQFYYQRGNLLWTISPDGTSFNVFDVTTQTLTTNYNNIAIPINGGILGCLTFSNDYLFIIGSNQWKDVQIYNTITDTWLLNVPKLQTHRTELSCAVINNEVYAIGGSSVSTVEYLPINDLLNIQNYAWQIISGGLGGTSRWRSVIYDNKIILVGGGAPNERDVVTIDPFTKSITKAGELNYDVHTVVPIIIHGRFYIFGGSSSNQIQWMYHDVATLNPTQSPAENPTEVPSKNPTEIPSKNPTQNPTMFPTQTPSKSPTYIPTFIPTFIPTLNPTTVPTFIPTVNPTHIPTVLPSNNPTSQPTVLPTNVPTFTESPSSIPTTDPTMNPTTEPTIEPIAMPSDDPTIIPSNAPTKSPENDGNAGFDTTFEGTNSGLQSQNNISTFLSENLILLIIVIAAALIICVICIVFVHKRKKGNKAEQKPNTVELQKVRSIEMMSETEPGEPIQPNTVTSVDGNDTYSNKNALKYWLNDIGMNEYFDTFVSEGFGDDISQMEALFQLTDDQLKSIGIAKLAHRNLILSKIQKLNIASQVSQVENRNENEYLLNSNDGNTAIVNANDEEENEEMYTGTQVMTEGGEFENEEMYMEKPLDTATGNHVTKDDSKSEYDNDNMYAQPTRSTNQ